LRCHTLFGIQTIFAAKINLLEAKIKVGAVSYLNTKPMLYGIERSDLYQDMELLTDYPARLAQRLQGGEIDLALLPVAAIPGIAQARIIGNYGIAADGNVASVCLYSQVPMDEIETVYLDYQSRTSVRLARILLEKHWHKKVAYKEATEHYIDYIRGVNAGVIIGDRALQQRANFAYIYDLADGWQAFTGGLSFVFAAWVANKDLPLDFIRRFDAANAWGLAHIDEVVAGNPFPDYNLQTYYRQNIRYELTDQRKKGLQLFLEMIAAEK
jgi:chorismate dehydratase